MPQPPPSSDFGATGRVLVSTQTGERTRLACRFRRRAETFCPTQIRPARRRTEQPVRLRSPFPPSAIIKRKPLSSTARRAGWVGCNFALNRIPGSARIPVVNEGTISPPSQVRERYQLARKQVEGLTVKQRGWRLDVLRVIQSLGKTEFSTSDVYAFERELAELHPDNEHVKEKIRQQLQELRDTGLLVHLGRGEWRLP